MTHHRNGSVNLWESHLQTIRYAIDNDNLIDNNEEDDNDAIVKLAMEREMIRERQSRQKHLTRNALQAEKTRSKDFGLKMLRIHESPSRDFVTVRLSTERCIRSIVVIQRFVRGYLVRKMMERLARDVAVIDDDRAEADLRKGGGWKEARDNRGASYFWNRTSGVTTYEEPNVYENISGDIVRLGTCRKYSPPEMWTMARTEDGRTYYFDKVTGARSWQAPPGWSVKEKSSVRKDLDESQKKNEALRKNLRYLRSKVRDLEASDLDLDLLHGMLKTSNMLPGE